MSSRENPPIIAKLSANLSIFTEPEVKESTKDSIGLFYTILAILGICSYAGFTFYTELSKPPTMITKIETVQNRDYFPIKFLCEDECIFLTNCNDMWDINRQNEVIPETGITREYAICKKTMDPILIATAKGFGQLQLKTGLQILNSSASPFESSAEKSDRPTKIYIMNDNSRIPFSSTFWTKYLDNPGLIETFITQLVTENGNKTGYSISSEDELEVKESQKKFYDLKFKQLVVWKYIFKISDSDLVILSKLSNFDFWTDTYFFQYSKRIRLEKLYKVIEFTRNDNWLAILGSIGGAWAPITFVFGIFVTLQRKLRGNRNHYDKRGDYENQFNDIKKSAAFRQ